MLFKNKIIYSTTKIFTSRIKAFIYSIIISPENAIVTHCNVPWQKPVLITRKNVFLTNHEEY